MPDMTEHLAALSEAELLPCPFCGGMPMQARESADERSGYCGVNMICCNDCTARVRIVDPSGPNGWALRSGMPEAIAAWNTRANQIAVVGPDAVEKVARAIYEEDDPWSKAWPWPNLDPSQGDPSAYRRLATAAIAALTGRV